MASVLLKRKDREESELRRHREGGGRDRSQASISQGMSRIAGSRQKLGGRYGRDASSEPPEGNNSADTLISDFWSMKELTENTFLL